MRWDDLALLLEVSRSATMTEAARRLRVDQTTISRRLRGFESTLGVQLVMRRRDGVQLTEAGLRAARAAEVMETVSHDLERGLVGSDARLSGRLRVTTVEVMAQHHPDLFTGFAARFPGVALELETHAGRRSLARREADVALRWSNAPSPALTGKRLARAEFAIYAARRLHLSLKASKNLEDYPWLGFTESTPAPHVHAFMREQVPRATVVCRYEDLPSLIAAIRCGAGVGFMPCAYADPDPALVRLRPIQPGFGFDLWCLAHADLAATARVRSFVDHASVYFKTRRSLYAGEAAEPA